MQTNGCVVKLPEALLDELGKRFEITWFIHTDLFVLFSLIVIKNIRFTVINSQLKLLARSFGIYPANPASFWLATLTPFMAAAGENERCECL